QTREASMGDCAADPLQQRVHDGLSSWERDRTAFAGMERRAYLACRRRSCRRRRPARTRPSSSPDRAAATGLRRLSVCEDADVAIATSFNEMFGCRHPLQQAGIGGVVTPDLAIAVARAGGLGMLTGTIGREALSAQLDVLPPDASI